MKTRYKILGSLVVLLAVAVLGLGLYVSHDGGCRAPAPLAAGAPRMQAMVYRCYGGPEVLKLESIAKPVAGDDQVLVRVRAASVNPLDWHYLRGLPYIMRFDAGVGAPTDIRLGTDFAGVVEAVGRNVRRFKVGDEVFGGADGAFGEYVVVRENRAIAHKPPNMSFEQAAAVPIAGVTALQALRDTGALRAGQKVLVNGASGGVGTFAVQIARTMGADVTGVCSTRNVDLVKSLGAHRVIDYKRQDFTTLADRYDLIIDTVGNHGVSALRRVLQPKGAVVIVGGPSEGKFLGPLSGVLSATVYSLFVSQNYNFMLAQLTRNDLEVLRDMMKDGRVVPMLDRRFALAETPAGVAYVEEGHARGKTVIDVPQ